ncbi:F-box/kelch-repeat protein At2g44130-like [Benincasa hispida]|uniref:F-box/kelch-repeat protein At2g44130-like n=1 Tax=Benincasa hispida TaxID=102211 RepID=UPI0018FF38CC|nr:F-box/kelch-repeat protein At2g44130-like [Benincasa hispida]
MERFEFELTELIPGLPEELGLDCITRLPHTTHRLASAVCRRWHQLISSPDFYYHRRKSGTTRLLACFIQALPPAFSTTGWKLCTSLAYGLTVFDSLSQSWERIPPIPQYPDGVPLFCHIASTEGKLVLMGGWDPETYDPIVDVFVYDFTRCGWRKGKDMPSKRSFFAIGASDGRIFISGGHDESKNALKSAWVYDLRTDEWTELPQMSQGRDECEGLMVGREFWVVSGYDTERQGMFDASAEVYDIDSGEWRVVDQAWEAGRCPRACVGMDKDGKLTNWSESAPAVRVGACGTVIGTRTVVTGSEYQGGPQNFHLMETEGGQNGKMSKINVPEEYSGYVQSGCCVEV